MDEHLIGYLLKTLDAVTHQRVERYLATHPAARAQLQHLEQALAPLAEDRDDPDPPPGLVFATLARVAEHQCRHLPDAPAPTSYQVGNPGPRWTRPIDWLVAALILVFAGGIGTSFLVRSWHSYERTACANNLRQFWGGLEAYADRSEGAFPRVEAEGARSVAAVYVPILQEAGVLTDASVRCPAQPQREVRQVSLRELETLYRDQPAQFRTVAREMGGNYAYSLGYKEGEQFCGLTRNSGDSHPIMADCLHPAGSGNSLNHGQSGQNVLYVGGVVRWCVKPTVGLHGDNIFINQNFQIRAGLHQTDSVLAVGDATPYRPE